MSWKILQFPVTRIFLGFIALLFATSITQLLVKALPGSETAIVSLFSVIVIAVVASLVYHGFVRLIERRPVTELALPGALTELGMGVFVGALLFSATIGIIWAFGYYQVTGVNGWSAVIPMLDVAIVSGVVEELLIRGILFRIIEESLGTWIALAISALIFGLLHLANPNATLWGAIAIAIEAGILLAAVFIFTRRLWFAIGLHFAWNFVQGAIFSVAVSGNEAKGLLQATLSGPDLLSGGSFGAEASIFAVIVCLSAGVYFLWKANQKGNFIQPFWKR